MKPFLLVFLGGGLGSASRYFIGIWLNSPTRAIPFGTLTVNILGSLLIGLILGWSLKSNTMHANAILILATGFCGGFTTFSTFAYENYSLLKSGDMGTFLIYTLTSLALGILAVFVGISISKAL